MGSLTVRVFSSLGHKTPVPNPSVKEGAASEAGGTVNKLSLSVLGLEETSLAGHTLPPLSLFQFMCLKPSSTDPNPFCVSNSKNVTCHHGTCRTPPSPLNISYNTLVKFVPVPVYKNANFRARANQESGFSKKTYFFEFPVPHEQPP